MEVIKAVRKRKRKKELLFYACLVALPSLQFIIFYIVVNFNSFLLAFQSYDKFSNSYSFAKLENFKIVFSEMSGKFFSILFWNSLKEFLAVLLIGFPLPILFSYYIYKNGVGGKIFKVILFMPQVISSMVLIIVYKYFVEIGVPSLVNTIFKGANLKALYSTPSTSFGTVVFYSIWGSFGVKLLLYLSAMYSIDKSVTEASKLDGIKYLQELRYIVMPSIYPTLVTYLVVLFAAFFTDQAGLFSFDGIHVPSEIQTIGYNIYIRTLKSNTDATNWPVLAAYGLLFTAITAPLTFTLRGLLTKYGPSED